MNLPSDYTPEEKEIWNEFQRRAYEPPNTDHIYALLKDPIDKFIVAYIYELGKPQKSAILALGLCKATIWHRTNRIKKIIAKYAESNHLITPSSKI